MFYFNIVEVYQDRVSIYINPSGYTHLKIFIRLDSNTSDKTHEEYVNIDNFINYNVNGFYYTSPTGKLLSGTTYAINISYGNANDNLAIDAANKQTFTTKTATSSVPMGINLGEGISSIQIQYTNEYGNISYSTISQSTTLYVMSNSTQSVTSISLKSGYKHPVTCSGQSTWQMTNADGSFNDRFLQMYTTSKTFTFSATVGSGTGSGTGVAWINGRKYQPYIYLSGVGWKPYKAYIYNGGWKETK